MATKNEVELEKSTTVASNAQNGVADLSRQDTAYSYVTDYPVVTVPWHRSILPKHVFRPSVVSSSRVFTSRRRIRKVANPTPLGLFAFAYSVFLLCLNQMQVKNIMVPNISVGPALAYGGLVQLLAGMWEMAIGNTFGATVLSSYGGFWISVAVIFIPGGFEIMPTLEKAGGLAMFYDSFSIYLWGWFIFTTMIAYITLRSTVALCALFVVVDTSVLLALAYMVRDEREMPHSNLQKAGGFFAVLTGFRAWYNGFAGLADNSNSFFVAPVVHFPWSEKVRKSRKSQ